MRWQSQNFTYVCGLPIQWSLTWSHKECWTHGRIIFLFSLSISIKDWRSFWSSTVISLGKWFPPELNTWININSLHISFQWNSYGLLFHSPGLAEKHQQKLEIPEIQWTTFSDYMGTKKRGKLTLCLNSLYCTCG